MLQLQLLPIFGKTYVGVFLVQCWDVELRITEPKVSERQNDKCRMAILQMLSNTDRTNYQCSKGQITNVVKCDRANYWCYKMKTGKFTDVIKCRISFFPEFFLKTCHEPFSA
jgi:hypothetical protein